MLIAVAHVTSDRQFGFFAIAFSTASFIAFSGPIGQQSAIMRFWPEWAGKGSVALARSYLLRSLRVSAIGLVASGALLMVAGAVASQTWRDEFWLLLSVTTALLALLMGFAEVFSSALRAQGALLTALLPKDIVWRLLVIAVTGAVIFFGGEISALAALLILGVGLAVALAPQAALVLQSIAFEGRDPLSPDQESNFRSVSRGLWGVMTVAPAMDQLATVLVGFLLGPELAGAFFAAQRTALLIGIALGGFNQVLAPQISQAYHAGDQQQVQWSLSVAASISTAVGLLGIVAFALCGNIALGFFDQSYATFENWLVLVILGLGQLFNAAAGSTSWLLQLTGRQHSLLKLLTLSSALGLASLALLAWIAGPIGAAVSMFLTLTLWNVFAVLDARRYLGLDPSILGARR